MKRKFEVEVVWERYHYVEIEVDNDELEDFGPEFEKIAVAQALLGTGSINDWYERRNPYIATITDITGRK